MRWPSLATTIYQWRLTRGITARRCGSFLALTNDGSTQGHVAAEVDVSSHGQMVKLYNLRYLLEAFLELLDLMFHRWVSAVRQDDRRQPQTDLLEVVTKLNDRCRSEKPVLINDELTMLQ